MFGKGEILLEKRNLIERDGYFRVEFETHRRVRKLFGGYETKVEKVLDPIKFFYKNNAEEYLPMVERPSKPFNWFINSTNDVTVYPKEWMEKLRALGWKEPVIERRELDPEYGYGAYRAVLNAGKNNEKTIGAALSLRFLIDHLIMDLSTIRNMVEKEKDERMTNVKLHKSFLVNASEVIEIPYTEDKNNNLYLIRNRIIDEEIKRTEEYKQALLKLKQ